jgi:hypothetical protein
LIDEQPVYHHLDMACSKNDHPLTEEAQNNGTIKQQWVWVTAASLGAFLA